MSLLFETRDSREKVYKDDKQIDSDKLNYFVLHVKLSNYSIFGTFDSRYKLVYVVDITGK